jgi:uncharacterized protein (TIGR03083 family)
MEHDPGLTHPQPIITTHLFPETLDHLLKLLSDLGEEEWQAPTICTGWSVKDVALHLLGVEIGNVSFRRDQHRPGGTIGSWDALVETINRWNREWVEVARRTSAPLLVELLGFVGERANEVFRSLDPLAMGGSIGWAGPEPQPVWLDIAREYTERWHHQQHIRDAVNKPGLKGPKYLKPVLQTFVWALPQAFRQASAPEGISITLSIAGDSGGHWTLLRGEGGWGFYEGEPTDPDTRLTMDQDFAWRFLTRGVSQDAVGNRIVITGDKRRAEPIFDMVSIIA